MANSSLDTQKYRDANSKSMEDEKEKDSKKNKDDESEFDGTTLDDDLSGPDIADEDLVFDS